MSLQPGIGSLFVGGGPAGLAPLVWAARQGTLRQLAGRGLVVVERGPAIGAGALGCYAIGSDTLAETFLECLEDSAEPRLGALRDLPATAAVRACAGGSVPLRLAAAFLDGLGQAMHAAIVEVGGQVRTGCEALSSRRLADGRWQTILRTATGTDTIVSDNLVLATGGRQDRHTLDGVSVAGAPLLQHYEKKLMLSGDLLATGGLASACERVASVGSPRIAIVGGSHSALAAANLLLNCRELELGPDALTVLHRRPLRVFYPSAAAALAAGFEDFDDDDICPVSQRLFRLAGFRLEARTLVMRALGIGGLDPEPRLRLRRLGTPEADAEALRIMNTSDLVIAALGYRPNGLALFDRDGSGIALGGSSLAAPMVDRDCRVLDAAGTPVANVMGLGLSAGFVPHGTLGGEPSFRGQTNGIWLWQNGVGAMIVDALLMPASSRDARHVAA